MLEYKNLELQDLLDLLVDKTNQYIKLRTEGVNKEEEIAHCWRHISLLQAIINQRSAIVDNKIITSEEGSIEGAGIK